VDGAKRSASAIATSDARLNVLFKPDLDEFINKYPKKGVKILTRVFSYHNFQVTEIK
jgi:hypothetical protein